MGGNDNVYKLDYGKLSVTRANVQAIALRYNSTDAKLEKDEDSDDGGDETQVINGHEYVDLGLPSGLLWAKTNIGADTETAYGDYYAWGETMPQSSKTYYWTTYKFSSEDGTSITKYTENDGKTTLDNEDDAAHAQWGSSWRMPTFKDFAELVYYCTTEFKTVNEVKGYKVTSKSNGNSIFLPAAGKLGESDTYIGSRGFYLFNERLTGDDDGEYLHARYFIFRTDKEDSDFDHGARCFGYSVRPVADKQN